jgi:hypothetical protein
MFLHKPIVVLDSGLYAWNYRLFTMPNVMVWTTSAIGWVRISGERESLPGHQWEG